MTDFVDNNTNNSNNLEEIGSWNQVKVRVTKPKKVVELANSDSNFPFIDINKNYTKNYNKNYNKNNFNNQVKTFLPSSSSNSTLTVSKTDGTNPLLLIRNWCESNLNTEEMMKKYEEIKHIVENPKFITKNITCVFDRLAQNWRHDVLRELRTKNKLFENNYNYHKKDGTPFNNLMFPSKIILNNLSEENIENLYKTFDELVKFKFNIFSFNQKEITNETFLMCVLYSGDKALLPQDIRTKAYEYFTNTFDSYEYYDSVIINFILGSNQFIDFISDKLLYLLAKYPNQSSSKIFEWVFKMEPNKQTKVNIDISNVIKAIMTNPQSDKDYYPYLETKNLNQIRNNFLDIIISNDLIWYNNWIEHKTTNLFGEKLDDLVINGYKDQGLSNLMLVYGEFYSYKVNQEKIIKRVCEILDESTNTLVQTLYFIKYSKIDLKNLNSNEKEFITKFVSLLTNIKLDARVQICNIFAESLGVKKITINEIISLVN